MTDIRQQSIQEFLDRLASKSPTPGGGSAAALMGAQSAALLGMVCNLTIGKPQYSEVEEDMRVLLEKSELLRARLTGLIDADIRAFQEVMSAYRLPKQTSDEQTRRSEAIQQALQKATDVPLQCARICAELIQLSRPAAQQGGKNVVSDAGVAVMAAHAALQSAALNVHINIGGIEDKQFAIAKSAELEEILQGSAAETEEIYRLVMSRL